MKIVISGGTGFLGSRLVGALRGGRHHILVLTRRRAAHKERRGVTYAHWDGGRSADLAGILDGADAVINLAGESIGNGRWTRARKRRILQSRINVTDALVEAMSHARHPPAVFLSASGVGIYGDTGDESVTEDHPPGRGFLAEVCLAWEASALQAKVSGVRVILPRMGLVLDSRGGALGRMAMPFQLFAGGTLGPGTQWFPWVHAGDMVRAYLHMLAVPSLQGPVNLAAPGTVRMKEFAATLGEVLGRPAWLPVPTIVLRAILGEMADTVLVGQRVVPAVLERSGFSFTFPALEPTLRDILC